MGNHETVTVAVTVTVTVGLQLESPTNSVPHHDVIVTHIPLALDGKSTGLARYVGPSPLIDKRAELEPPPFLKADRYLLYIYTIQKSNQIKPHSALRLCALRRIETNTNYSDPRYTYSSSLHCCKGRH